MADEPMALPLSSKKGSTSIRKTSTTVALTCGLKISEHRAAADSGPPVLRQTVKELCKWLRTLPLSMPEAKGKPPSHWLRLLASKKENDAATAMKTNIKREAAMKTCIKRKAAMKTNIKREDTLIRGVPFEPRLVATKICSDYWLGKSASRATGSRIPVAVHCGVPGDRERRSCSASPSNALRRQTPFPCRSPSTMTRPR